VHLNLPFREPLIPQLPDFVVATPDRSGPPPRTEPSPGDISALATLLAQRPRGIIVAGPDDAPDSTQAITGLAARLGYPILADPLSQLRRGPHDRLYVIDSYDAFLRSPVASALQPDVVLRVGATPTSKSLSQFLGGLVDGEQVVIAPLGRWNDPDLRAIRSLDADPTAVFRRLQEALVPAALGAAPPPAASWLAQWRECDEMASAAFDAVLRPGTSPGSDEAAPLSELGAINELIDALPPNAALVAGNSMPIRDVESVLRSGDRPLHVFANRGASGIDGVVSTALGVSAGRPQAPLALVIGDLSLYHDMNGLIAAGRFGLSATVVVLNNDGGGIFSLLPQAEQVPEFEELFGTPHGLHFEHAAAQYGLDYTRPSSRSAYRTALEGSLARPGVQLIEVQTDRVANAALHREAWDRVRQSLSGHSGPG
jgi:2-succinyl-5-enolpyruvyl-6-hydroxy-3-cyclohexene-1-carboxylate synthase